MADGSSPTVFGVIPRNLPRYCNGIPYYVGNNYGIPLTWLIRCITEFRKS